MMQTNDRERKLNEARQAAAKLIVEAHQLPIALSLAFDAAQVQRHCERIRALAQAVDRAAAAVAQGPQEFNE